MLKSRIGWDLLRDGSPNGETPVQISDLVDRFIVQAHVLAMRWIASRPAKP